MNKLIQLFLVIFLLNSCNSNGSDSIIDDSIDSSDSNFNWTIPTSDLAGSNNPFTLVKNPNYTLAKNVEFISNELKVALISFNENEIFAYPYKFISTYEIINDIHNNTPYSLTYCPITKSAVLFESEFNSIDTFIFRSSGYLYKENLIAIDQKTNTYWSQFLLKCVKGKYQNEHLNTFNVIETTWETVKNNFPNANVFTNTSIANSNKTAKKSYKSTIDDNELVYGILEDDSKNELPFVHIYQYNLFNQGIEIKTNNINSENIIVLGSSIYDFITSYKIPNGVTFTAIQNDFPNVMIDSNNTVYNVFGIGVSGPDKGVQLKSPRAFAASFWAWKAFYPSIIEES